MAGISNKSQADVNGMPIAHRDAGEPLARAASAVSSGGPARQQSAQNPVTQRGCSGSAAGRGDAVELLSAEECSAFRFQRWPLEDSPLSPRVAVREIPLRLPALAHPFPALAAVALCSPCSVFVCVACLLLDAVLTRSELADWPSVPALTYRIAALRAVQDSSGARR